MNETKYADRKRYTKHLLCNEYHEYHPDGIREISRRLRLREMHFLSGWKN